MLYQIVVCDQEPKMGAWIENLCRREFERRSDTCSITLLDSYEALLRKDEAGERYDIVFLGLSTGREESGLQAAAALRARGRRMPLVLLARCTDYAYRGFQVGALQYLVPPIELPDISAVVERVAEPYHGPYLAVATATGLRLLSFGEIEYVECIHHVVHFHMRRGEDVASVSQRAPFTVLAGPLLEDPRFVQPHRSYIINMEALSSMGGGELVMESGMRLPLPRDREPGVRAACFAWAERSRRSNPMLRPPVHYDPYLK